MLHVRLNEQETEKLNALLTYKTFKKNQHLSLQEMKRANSYYVISGCLRSKVDERYRNFVKQYATLIPELSQKQIA